LSDLRDTLDAKFDHNEGQNVKNLKMSIQDAKKLLISMDEIVFAQNENSKIKNSTGLTDAVLKNTLTTITSQQRIRFAKLIFFFPR